MTEWTQPLPCLVCGMQPEPAFRKHDEHCMQPYAATMFNAGSGHYGSTVWDSMSNSRSLEINICDECLVKHKDRVAVRLIVRRASDVTYTTWDVDSDVQG